jgi:hypothetical protein
MVIKLIVNLKLIYLIKITGTSQSFIYLTDKILFFLFSISLFLITLNIEPLGKSGPDFLSIQNTGEKYHGVESLKLMAKSNDTLNLHFKSDWITTQALKEPAGFLLYFNSKL